MAKKRKPQPKKPKPQRRPNSEKVTRNHKATVFSSLFGQPSAELEIYNAISGANLPPDTAVRDVTVQGVLYRGLMNDLAFTVDDVLVVLVEQEASANPNMPLRFLLYIAEVYAMIVDKAARFGYKLAKIARPEFVVLYNGTEPFPERATYKLSDAFKDADGLLGELATEVPLELTATVYNINEGCNEELIKRSPLLHGYVKFNGKIRSNVESGMALDEAMAKAIEECKAEGVLKEYLERHGEEVGKMLREEWDQRVADEYLKRDYFEDGLAVGEARGEAQKAVSVAKNMMADNEPIEKIIRYTGLTRTEIESLRSVQA